MEKVNLQVFIEDLEETILRLHNQFRNWEEKYDQFKKIRKFLSEPGAKEFTPEIQEEMETYDRYRFYKGKFYAYYHVLNNLGSDVIPVLKRLRGIEMTSSIVIEKKAHYTEVMGHFDTDEWLAIKNQEPKVENN